VVVDKKDVKWKNFSFLFRLLVLLNRIF
jgi:hypothetical protein